MSNVTICDDLVHFWDNASNVDKITNEIHPADDDDYEDEDFDDEDFDNDNTGDDDDGSAKTVIVNEQVVFPEEMEGFKSEDDDEDDDEDEDYEVDDDDGEYIEIEYPNSKLLVLNTAMTIFSCAVSIATLCIVVGIYKKV